MNNDLENIDDILGKYLSGEASAAEATMIDEWRFRNDENQRYFNQMKQIFEGASSLRQWKDYDTDAAWNKVRANLRKETTPVIPMQPPQRSSSPSWWRAAAAIAMVMGVGLYVYLTSGSVSRQMEVISDRRAVTDTLPDGSQIFLNRQTKVMYAYDKKTNTHDVKLNGEAYFSIKHNDEEQFIIDAGEVFIKDIGTSFNVKAYPETETVEVLVEEGEIIFYTAENPGVHLKQSGKAIYNKKTKQFTIDQPEPNITAYKTKFFVFSGTNLEEAAEALNQVYDTPLVVPDHLKNCPITVSFKNESIDEIAAVIAETLSLTVSKVNGRIELNGKACE